MGGPGTQSTNVQHISDGLNPIYPTNATVNGNVYVSSSSFNQINFMTIYDSLQVAGGFFEGYGWTSFGKEILEFDQGLKCADDMVNLMKALLNKMYDDYHNSPCVQLGSDSSVKRPWYYWNETCEEKWGYGMCTSCTSYDTESAYYPTCEKFKGGAYVASEMYCSECYPACPSWEHPMNSVEFFWDTGMLKTTSKTVKQATELVKCIEKEITAIVKEKNGTKAETEMQKVINDVMPKLVDSLDELTDGATLVAMEVADVAKIGTHIGYLTTYLKSKKYEKIGWELGAIAYDITLAVKGETSATIDGKTYNFIEVKDQSSYSQALKEVSVDT